MDTLAFNFRSVVRHSHFLARSISFFFSSRIRGGKKRDSQSHVLEYLDPWPRSNYENDKINNRPPTRRIIPLATIKRRVICWPLRAPGNSFLLSIPISERQNFTKLSGGVCTFPKKCRGRTAHYEA